MGKAARIRKKHAEEAAANPRPTPKIPTRHHLTKAEKSKLRSQRKLMMDILTGKVEAPAAPPIPEGKNVVEKLRNHFDDGGRPLRVEFNDGPEIGDLFIEITDLEDLEETLQSGFKPTGIVREVITEG